MTATGWVAAGLLLIAAWWVAGATPTRSDALAPIPVVVPVGTWGNGREIRARVVGARFAGSVIEYPNTYPANWLIVDLDAASVTGEDRLRYATVTVDDVTYSATDGLYPTLLQTALVAGLPRSGMLVFELPPDLRTGRAELRVALSPEPVIDSVIAVPIDLDGLDRVESVELSLPTWTSE